MSNTRYAEIKKRDGKYILEISGWYFGESDTYKKIIEIFYSYRDFFMRQGIFVSLAGRVENVD